MKQFAPAKINLYLHILGRRSDGFHELETLMAPISIFDTVEMELTSRGCVEFTCSDPSLSEAKDNLATQAARLFLSAFDLHTGVRIHLDKGIPVGAGLGGGSSDAATVFLMLRELTQTPCDDARLSQLAGQLGSDVPFFIHRSAALCRGRGEKVEPCLLHRSTAQPLEGVLVHPGFGVSTPWSYKTFAQNPGEGERGREFPDFTLRNDLERPAFQKYLWLPAMKSWFRSQARVLDSLMSGSGSSVFALTEEQADRESLCTQVRDEFGADLFAQPFKIFG